MLTRELTSGVSFGDRLFAARRTATVQITFYLVVITVIFIKVIAFTPCDLLILNVKSDSEIEWLFKDYLNSVS